MYQEIVRDDGSVQPALVIKHQADPGAFARIKAAIKADFANSRQQIVFGYPVVDNELGGMVVPEHIKDQVFGAVIEQDRLRKHRAVAQALFWMLVGLLAMGVLVLQFTDGLADVLLLLALLMVEGFARIKSRNCAEAALRRGRHENPR